MKTPLILFAVSMFLSAFGYFIPVWSDALLLGVPCAVASLWLIWRAWFGGNAYLVDAPKPKRVTKRGQRSRPRVDLNHIQAPAEAEIGARKWVIVDGSNVMHWINNEPNIKPLLDVLERLEHHGYTAGVMFDASAGHQLQGRYGHDGTFRQLLGLPLDRIMVVPTGTVADQYILKAARDFRAKIVTNDRYRDWADDFPEVNERDFLITGWYRDGALFTSLGQKPKRSLRVR
ncbi:NYN domain-containing protein [Planktotalea arctica]|uniref:NYN domain-containing protein n=1 Tax=Planktotalea arctica TaxID=1481893 RepID=UPI00321AFDB0